MKDYTYTVIDHGKGSIRKDLYTLYLLDRVRPFGYRYRIPVSVTITVSGTVKVLNGTQYQQYPIPTSKCRYR